MNSGKNKMLIKFILIAALPMISAKINLHINLTVSSSINNGNISWSGRDNKLITDREVTLFNITTANLNKAMRRELGKVPDGIFLKDPTPYGNLYHKYKWVEIHRTMYVDKVTTSTSFTEDVVLEKFVHINNSTDQVPCERSLYTTVDMSAQSKWSEKGFPDDDFKYSVLIKCDNSSFEYVNQWRNESFKSGFAKFGTAEKINIILQPGEEIMLKLMAKKTYFDIYIEYVAKLNGNLIADYENLYGKYHFYAPTVNNIMRAGKINNEIRTKEKIIVMCYTDPKLVAYKRKTGDILKLSRVYLKDKRN